MRERVAGALIGLACGDAVGTTLEFAKRDSFEPIKDMVGGGPFDLEPGQWTDDTSMALCLAHSLVYRNGFDPVDQMNRYCNWYQYGYMSSTGECFDIGSTVSNALTRYLDTGDPYSGSAAPETSGNGSIMRLAPVPMFYHRDAEKCLEMAGESSQTTHASEECIESCRLLASLIRIAFKASSKSQIFDECTFRPKCDKVRRIADQEFMSFEYKDLTGSGYVIESLESALWCFMRGDSFEECILLSANIGSDADTTAAICGQISGAYYGANNIPERWKSRLAMLDEIQELASNLHRAAQ